MEQIKALEHLVETGDLSGALDFIEALSQEERNQWQIQNLTGAVCSYCGQFNEAVTFFEAALKQRPDEAEVLYNLADAYTALGKNQLANNILDRCQQNTDDPGLLEDIAALRRKVAEQNDRRVLMVAYYFPPLSGSGVFRSIKFVKYLPLFGWQPTVISTDRPPIGWNYADESQVKEIPEGTEVIRVPDKIGTGRETTLNADRVKELLDFLGDILPYSAKADIIFTQALQTIESAKYLVTFPCNALSWACDTAHYIEKNMDLNRFQAIYTTSGPRSAHLVGFYLKQKYGIPWVADYRDQWTFNPYGEKYDPNNVRQLLLFELESILLHQADCNLTIGDSLIQSYAEEFHLPREKIASITNGYDESDFAALQAPQGRTDKFTINYSGLLYTQQRSIAPILTAIQQLSDEKKIKLPNVRFRIVGDAEDGSVEVAEQYGLTQIIERTGYLSHRQALQANVDANVLLLLVGDEARFKQGYTGKIFEYLRSGRPILALAPKDGVVDQLLRESGHGEAMLSTQTSRIKSMILREYEKWERGEGQELLHSPVIDRFERRILTEQLADVLSNVVNKDDSSPVTGGEPQPSQGAKYLVICNGGYPIEGYPRCIFAHDRVLQYAKAGVKVDAFGFIWGSPLVTYEYEGVNVTQGGAPELQELLQRKKYEKLLIHVIDEAVMYAIKKAGMQDMPMIIWCHGYEVMPWYRCWFNYTPEELRRNSLTMESENRGKQHFLKQIYAQDNIHFVFVSTWQMGRSKKYVGTLPKHCEVIHNYINYPFFASPEKAAEDRLHILSIKNHAARTYGNDLTAKAILELSKRKFFPRLTFELHGEGKLFEENFGELLKKNFPNVHIYRGFLDRNDMRKCLRSNGVFLSPTRMDSHQLTMSEAMSAGLAVITSNAGPTREFIDEDCGSIFEFDNYWMMAEEIEYLYYNPEEFLRKSRNAVKRVQTQCSYQQTIGRELQLITGT